MSIEKIAENASLVASMIENIRIKQNLDTGKETPESREARFQKVLEEIRTTVQPIYNSKGKLIEYDEYGRHLDVKA